MLTVVAAKRCRGLEACRAIGHTAHQYPPDAVHGNLLNLSLPFGSGLRAFLEMFLLAPLT